MSAKYPLGLRQWEGIGFYPNMNTPYGIDELGLHDPVVSSTYFAAWPVAGADPSGGGLNLFVPNVDTVALARKYGVGYVLSFPGYSPPKGMSPVAKIGHEVLSRVPDSGRFTIGTSLAPLSFTQPNDTTYTVDTVGRSGSLVARITNSPGWQASVDGKDLPISAVGGAAGESGVFLQVTVPPGSRSVTFHYQPPHALIADALLLLTLLAYAGAGAVSFGRRARRRSSGVPGQTAGRILPSREAQRLPSTIPRAPG